MYVCIYIRYMHSITISKKKRGGCSVFRIELEVYRKNWRKVREKFYNFIIISK